MSVKCFICGKSEYKSKLQVITIDGDFICRDGECKKKWNREKNFINNCSSSQFMDWVKG